MGCPGSRGFSRPGAFRRRRPARFHHFSSGSPVTRRNAEQGDLFEHVPQSIWQARFYDFNVWTARKRVEKLRYMHPNPVKRGLVESPELGRWSSYRAYACGERGVVKVSEWQVLKLKVRKTAA